MYNDVPDTCWKEVGFDALKLKFLMVVSHLSCLVAVASLWK